MKPVTENSRVAAGDEVTGNGTHSTATQVSSSGGILLAEPNAEALPNGRPEVRLEHDRAVARQRLIWEHRQFIFRWCVAGLVLSTLIALLIPRRFQSMARLMPPDQTNSSMNMLSTFLGSKSGSGSVGLGTSGLGEFAGDLLGIKNSGDLFVGILQSRTVEDDIITKFDLRKVYWDRSYKDAREDLEKRTDISSDRKSGIIKLEVTDHDPKRAAAIAQEYVEELNRVVIKVNTSSAHRERVFLEERLGQVKQDLESAEKNFSEFASENTALDIPNQGKAMIEAVATMEGQYVGAETELEGLKQLYSDGNVRVRTVQARVEELRRALEKDLGAKSGELSTGPNGQLLYPSIRELPVLGVSYADLFRNTKLQEAIFETLTQEYELARVEEAKETPTVKVLDAPDVPEKKSFPPRLLIIVSGAMLVLVGAAIWILGKERWDNTEPENPRKVLAQEVIHTVRKRMFWMAPNGSGSGAMNGGPWTRSDTDQAESGR